MFSAARLGKIRKDRDGGFRAFQREALLTDEAAVEEVFELFAAQKVFEDAQFLFGEIGPDAGLRLHLMLQPELFFGPLNIHVFGADFAAVSGAKQFDHFAQCDLPASPESMLQGADEEMAIEIPDSEAVGERIELRIIRGFFAEGIELGHQMTAHAKGVNELDDGGFLDNIDRRLAGGRGRGLVAFPLDRSVGNFQGFENFVVETVFAIEQRLQLAEERAGFRALDNPMIVSAGDRHDFADARARQSFPARRRGIRQDNPSRRRR